MIEIGLSKDDILNVISELDIFRFYCSNFREVDVKFNSEFREDPTPSCVIGLWGGFYLYKDFGESTSHNCFGYIMRKYSCSYEESCTIISRDFNLVNIYQNFDRLKLPKSVNLVSKDKLIKQKGTIIKVKRREWLNIDTAFWTKKYGIHEETCKLFKVSPINYFWINEYLYSCGLSNTYCYYYYKDTQHRFKIYQPYNLKNKWYSNINNTVIQGIKALPKSGDTLIITKSLKDVMTLYELDFNAVASNNETSFIPEVNLEKFKKRFKNIYLYFDSDSTGIKFGTMFSNKYGLKMIYNPSNEPKDISDVVSYKGQRHALNLLKNLL